MPERKKVILLFKEAEMLKRKLFEQECIPVGCVPSAAVAMSASGPGGGVCLWSRGVSASGPGGGGGVCL